LVRACADNDERAWAEFTKRFHLVIAATVMRTAGKWGETSSSQEDDLIQETLLKLCEDKYRLLRSFKPRQEDSIYGFLKVVTANVVRDEFRSAHAVKRGADQTGAILDPDQTTSETADPDGFDLVSHRLQIERINKALLQVTEGRDQRRKRAIFWLRHRQGFTAAEIAAIPWIGLSTEGVESVLLRLMILIRSHLESTAPHREVKVLTRRKRSKRVGG
jgi:RNA polymerase sigma-70 factor (ECF subfamily)